MKKLLILSVIAACFSCNSSSTGSDAGNTDAGSASGTAPSNEMSTDAIKNPSTASDPTAQPGALPVMTFKSDEFDFGDIIENQEVETTYEFTNTGNADLLISDCKAACGCTVPNWPHEPIKPGKGGAITVKFNSAGKSGVNNKVVTVINNTKEGSKDLKFRANVQAVKKSE